MTQKDVLDRIRTDTPELKRLGLGKLYLFGSVAREESVTNDVDLLYEAADEKALNFFDLVDATDRLERLLGRPVDLIDRKFLHRRIRLRVEAELVEIY